jgi:hypothetical protein
MLPQVVPDVLGEERDEFGADLIPLGSHARSMEGLHERG